MRTALGLLGLLGKNHPMGNPPWKTIRIALAVAVIAVNCDSARSDTVYVWSDNSTIKQFTTNGVGSVLASNIYISGWNGPVGLAVDNAGNLYSGCPGTSKITKYATNGTTSVVGGPVDSVSGLAFDCAGNFYETSPNYMSIGRLCRGGPYGYYSGTPCSPGTGWHLNFPTSLAFDSEGNIYATTGVSTLPFVQNNSYTNLIARFSSDLTYLGDFATNLNAPWGLAFDQAGNLFVSNSGDDTIYKFTPDGTGTEFANSTVLWNPRGLAFDSAGNLYVANAGNGIILKFTSAGSPTVFASGLNLPTSIAIYPGLRFWTPLPKLGNPTRLPDGEIQFSFGYTVGTSFSALASTNMSLPLSLWTELGGVTEVWPGQFQFTDTAATNHAQRFYRVRAN